jgi:hypothetical protein
MVKFKIKLKNNASPDNIKNVLDALEKLQSNEIPFNFIIKLAKALGAEYQNKGQSRGKGSMERFYHKDLANYHHYTNGYFSVHVVHKGKSQVLVHKKNFQKYILPHLRLLLELKKEESK